MSIARTAVWHCPSRPVYNGCDGESEAGENRDLVSNLSGEETSSLVFQSGCKTAGSAELWTIANGIHSPSLSASFAQQLVDWLFAHPKSEWPSPYNGITPKPSLSLTVNNISSFHAADDTLYSCVRIFSSGLPSSVGGISEYDIGFVIVSAEQGTMRIEKTRPFNAANALNANNEVPDCSGIFETGDNVYSDHIQVGEQTFTVEFQLSDDAILEFTLISFTEVFSQ